MRNLILSFTALSLLASCGDGPFNHNYNALDNHKYSETFVEEYDRKVRIQYHLDNEAIKFDLPYGATAVRGTKKVISFNAEITHPDVLDYTLTLTSTHSNWITLQRDESSAPSSWTLTIDAPENSNVALERIAVQLELIPTESTDPKTLERIIKFNSVSLKRNLSIVLSPTQSGDSQ